MSLSGSLSMMCLLKSTSDLLKAGKIPPAMAGEALDEIGFLTCQRRPCLIAGCYSCISRCTYTVPLHNPTRVLAGEMMHLNTRIQGERFYDS